MLPEVPVAVGAGREVFGVDREVVACPAAREAAAARKRVVNCIVNNYYSEYTSN